MDTVLERSDVVVAVTVVDSPLTWLRQVGFPFRAKGVEDLGNFFASPQFILNRCDALLLARSGFLVGRRRRRQKSLQVFLEHLRVLFVEVQRRSPREDLINIRSCFQKQSDGLRSLTEQSVL